LRGGANRFNPRIQPSTVVRAVRPNLPPNEIEEKPFIWGSKCRRPESELWLDLRNPEGSAIDGKFSICSLVTTP